MKSRISFSAGSITMSACIVGFLTASGVYNLYHDDVSIATVCFGLLIVLVTTALFFAPLSVSVNDKEIGMHSLLRTKRIALKDVTGVHRYAPTMGTRRIFASGGFWGYWGKFKEGDTGSYYGFYGKASDCFIITTSCGKKYVIGCNNPDTIVSDIASKIHRHGR